MLFLSEVLHYIYIYAFSYPPWGDVVVLKYLSIQNFWVLSYQYIFMLILKEKDIEFCIYISAKLSFLGSSIPQDMD